MKNPRTLTLALTFVALIASALFIDSMVRARTSLPQDPERSFDVERYPNEPVELIDLKVRGNSVKNGLKFKMKDAVSKWGLDNVKFREKDNWFKDVKVRLRNVSGKPITSLTANLYLKRSDLRMLFRISLTLRPNRDLQTKPLQDGEDIELEVNETSFDETMTSLQVSGIDPNTLPISLSVDNAMFEDNFQWHRGKILRRDPYSPNKWDPVDKPATGKASRSNQSPGFFFR